MRNLQDETVVPLEPTTKRKPPKYSEDDLAMRFTARHGDDWRYVPGWSRWLVYENGKWTVDNRMRVFNLARAICREAATDAKNPRLATARTRAAIESLVRSDPQHARSIDVWDANPWLLNTPMGTVELMTGEMRPHRRDDHLTFMTAVEPGTTCPMWLEFLRRITDGDDSLQAYLQRAIGYALTGSTRDHALFHCYGTGANGKSVFTNTIAGILGAYHRAAPVEMFMASTSERHPTELAMLRGARFVTAVETEEGRRWAESKIKALTGGDPIAARFMRQDFFEFTPVFKLMVTGNHKPHLRSVDEAMRRRLHLIPFTVTIPEDERDETLPERLRAEWPGILQWCIEGALEWQETGLRPPEAVRSATDHYLDAEDALAAWIEDRCNTGTSFVAPSSQLYKSWRVWCDEAGEHPGSQRRFSQNLEARGFRWERTAKARQFRGICPKPDPYPLPYQED